MPGPWDSAGNTAPRVPVHLTPPPLTRLLFYSRAIARRGRKQWRSAWACATTASCTTVITPSPPPASVCPGPRPLLCFTGGKWRPRDSMAGTRRWSEAGDPGRPFGCSFLASALCCNSEVSKLYAKGQTGHVVQASQAAQPLSQLSSALQPKGRQAMCKQTGAAGCPGTFAVAAGFPLGILSRSGPWS